MTVGKRNQRGRAAEIGLNSSGDEMGKGRELISVAHLHCATCITSVHVNALNALHLNLISETMERFHCPVLQMWKSRLRECN